MNHEDQHSDPSLVGDGLSIRGAAEFLGVPAPTLRSWERRYGLPLTSRSVGGHRRYRAPELRQLSLMRDEIAIGRHAGDAARWVRWVLDEEKAGMARVQELLTASGQLDPVAIGAVLERNQEEIGLGATLDEVVMPAMRQIGSWWQTGRCDIGQEQITTQVIRGWMAKIVTLAPTPGSDRSVLLATGPADLHTLGLEALAALLSQERIGSRVLGPRTPTDVLVAAALAESAAAVVVVSHLPTQRRSAVGSIDAVAATGAMTFYAGNAFLFPSSRKRVPGTYLGESITGAALVIGGALGAPDPQRAPAPAPV